MAEIHYGLVIEDKGYGCFVCPRAGRGTIYFDNDLEERPENHACVAGVCSEGCGIRLIRAAEAAPSCYDWDAIRRLLGQNR